MVMIADRIKALREKSGLSQSQVAKRFQISRSSVNAWEMGYSVPSTQYLAELALLFQVSTDYLLGLQPTASLSLDGLTEEDIQMVHSVVAHLRQKNAT